ncbi:MAG: glyoxylate/hydroxypyruvate reductase A [Vicinamibacterales bacterium]
MNIILNLSGIKTEPWAAAFQALMPDATVQIWSPGAPPADYAVVWAPSQQFLDEQSRLKALFAIGAGVDALVKLRLPAHTLLVRIDDGGMGVQMAEYVTHAVLRHFREFDVYAQTVAERRWLPRRPRASAEFPVGIMGLGVLGRCVAGALARFDFPLRGWSRTVKSLHGVESFTGPDQLAAFLAGTRILVCLLPLTAETTGILNRETLSALMPGGYVINVARGAHLVDEDLIALLDSGHLAGATLDVFHTEPLPADHPFWADPRITITPHISARTVRDETASQITTKIRALERGESIAGVVDLARGY